MQLCLEKMAQNNEKVNCWHIEHDNKVGDLVLNITLPDEQCKQSKLNSMMEEPYKIINIFAVAQCKSSKAPLKQSLVSVGLAYYYGWTFKIFQAIRLEILGAPVLGQSALYLLDYFYSKIV